MRRKLFEVLIYRGDQKSLAHLVASSEEMAANVVAELQHDLFSLRRVDETLDEEQRLGLNTLLENAPIGFASWSSLGWVAHTAPVEELQFFRSKDASGADIYAVAPNMSVASAVFGTTILPTAKPHLFVVQEGFGELSTDMIDQIIRLLEFGPVGIAEFDEEKGRWFVW